jgi:hypothetical protein
MPTRFLFFVAAALLTAGCSSESKAPERKSAFERGVTLSSSAQCIAEPVIQSVSIQPRLSGYRVTATSYFDCQRRLAEPYLVDIPERPATLVLRPKPNSGLFSTSCECPTSLTVDVEGRLKRGQRLYVVNNHEVIGDVVVP